MPDSEKFNEGKLTKIKRVSEKRIKQEYIAAKKEEYCKRQKRHEERLQFEKEKLELEKKTLLEQYLLNGQNK